MEKIEFLLRILSDGSFHSGERLAEQLNVTRSAIWKLVRKLKSWQIEIYSVTGKGYKIPGGLDLLDKSCLQKKLSHNHLFKQVDVFTSIDSTSDYLSRQWKSLPGVGRVCIAEHQSAGKGRKGRVWVSPFAANLYFSIGVSLPLGLSALGGLSLAIGISLAKTLNQWTNRKIKVKWPNDLMVDDRKLAGILVEACGESNDHSFLNIGVGINWNMQPEHASELEQPWINLKELSEIKLSRNQILAEVLIQLDKTLTGYLSHGFTEFLKDWNQLSAMIDRSVTVHLANSQVNGIEAGIELSGALRLETESGIQIFHSGEVSLRKRR